ncbi:MAG: hypothetical protein NTW17_01090 [Candidatus Pacearchaeota archaeon]|nr:hypothetical protein [Candidatus Pacearchaeota archaeon]
METDSWGKSLCKNKKRKWNIFRAIKKSTKIWSKIFSEMACKNEKRTTQGISINTA